MRSEKNYFGAIDGQDVHLFSLVNSNGVTVKISNYGGTITSILVPNASGNVEEISCGFNSLEGYFSELYKENNPYFGGIVGRYCSLIENATFNLNGNIYNVSKNAEPHNLHGGTQGFNVKVWDAVLDASNPSAASLILSRKSPHMEEGFPGEVDVKVTYTLDDSNALTINYQATSSEDTPLTLTNHAYFNLSGFKEDIQEHFISVAASNKMEMDESCIVNGTQIALEGSIEDLRKGQHIKTVHDAINDGFEHYYVFDKQLTKSPQKVVEIKSELGQRAMEVHTTEPGMLFYTGKYTSNNLKREDGLQYGKFRGLCFETQRFPNGPNIKGYEDAILRKGKTFKSTTIFKFKW